MPSLPIIASVDDKAVGPGLKGMESKVVSSSKRAADAMEKNMAASANRVNRSMSSVGSSMASNMSKGMDRLKSSAAAGAIGGFASAGLRSMTDNYIAAGDAAATAGNKMDSVLKASGQTGAADKLEKMADIMSRKTGMDDDDITEASAKMISLGANADATSKIFPKLAAKARLSGKDMSMAATVAGKAFESGNVKGLKRIGIDIDAMGEKSIKAAYKISNAAGQLELLAQLEKNLGTVDIGAGIDASVAAKGYYATQAGNLEEAMGKGASAMRAKWQGAAAPLVGAAANSSLAPALGGAMEIATQLAPVTTAFVTLGQAMPALKELPNVGSAVKSAFGSIGDAMKASGLAATLAGDAHLLAARNINVAAKSVSAGSIMNPQSTAGKVGVGLAAVAGIGYGLNEAVIGTRIAMRASDEEMEKERGGLAAFHSKAANFYEKYNYRGLKRQYDSASLDRQIAEQNRKNKEKFGARRARAGGYEATVKVTVPQSQIERDARAY